MIYSKNQNQKQKKDFTSREKQGAWEVDFILA